MLALQFAIKVAANANNPVYETIFNPQYVDHLSRKQRVIPTFGICVREPLELNFNPDIIANIHFPETPPLTFSLTPMANLTLSNAKKDEMDPSMYKSSSNA